jgi:hypothetical protein
MPVVAFHREPLPSINGQRQWREVKVTQSSQAGPDGVTPKFTVVRTTTVNGVTGERTSRLETTTPVTLNSHHVAPGERYVDANIRRQFGNRFERRAVTTVTRTPVKDLTRPNNRPLQEKVNWDNNLQLSEWELPSVERRTRHRSVLLQGPSPTGSKLNSGQLNNEIPYGPDLKLRAKGIYSHTVSDTYTPEALYSLPHWANPMKRFFNGLPFVQLEEKFVSMQSPPSRLNCLCRLFGQDEMQRRSEQIQQNLATWRATHKGWKVQYQRHIKAGEPSVKQVRLPFLRQPLVTWETKGRPIVTPFIEVSPQAITSNRTVQINGQRYPNVHASRGVFGEVDNPEAIRQFNRMTRANNPQAHWERLEHEVKAYGGRYYPSHVKVEEPFWRLPFSYRQMPRTVDLSTMESAWARWLQRHYLAWRNAGFNPAERDAARQFMDAVARRSSRLFTAI